MVDLKLMKFQDRKPLTVVFMFKNVIHLTRVNISVSPDITIKLTLIPLHKQIYELNKRPSGSTHQVSNGKSMGFGLKQTKGQVLAITHIV